MSCVRAPPIARLEDRCTAYRARSHDAIVTPDNFNRAETDMYFRWMIRLAGGIGCFHHRREVMPIEWQTVVRPNRDTLYSSAVFDLDAAPVTITLPDSGARFMSMLILDQDQFAPAVVHGTGRHVLEPRADRDAIRDGRSADAR